MKKQSSLLFLIFLVLSIIVLAACSSQPPSDQPVESSSSQVALPAEYAGKNMPASSNASAGKEAFQIYCASCHGEKGLGDGVAASSLNPAPQNLAENQKQMSDAYLYWRIAEGGMMEPFKSAMPSWKGILSDDQIWDMVSFIRTLTG